MSTDTRELAATPVEVAAVAATPAAALATESEPEPRLRVTEAGPEAADEEDDDTETNLPAYARVTCAVVGLLVCAAVVAAPFYLATLLPSVLAWPFVGVGLIAAWLSVNMLRTAWRGRESGPDEVI